MGKLLARKERFADVTNFIAAVCLAAAPWVLGFAEPGVAAWNAWASAAVMAILALAALLRHAEWGEWLEGAAGLWVVASPWLLGFAGVTTALWTHVVIGLVVLVVAVAEIVWTHKHGPTVAA
jgi:hypothetical protein